MNKFDKILGLLLQILFILLDIFVLAAIIIVSYYVSIVLGIICVIYYTYINKNMGGWFFAWRPKTSKKFKENWERIMESK